MTVRLRPNGKSCEVRIIRAVLKEIGIKNGCYSFTVESLVEANKQHDNFCSDLDRGIIPPEILEYARAKGGGNGTTVDDIYRIMLADKNYHSSPSGIDLIKAIYPQVSDIKMASYTRADLLLWIDELKSMGNAPGTIRKKVRALRAIFDYALRSENSFLTINVFDQLPVDYSRHKNHKDRSNKEVKRDITRNRRLNPGEEETILQTLNEMKHDPRRAGINGEFKPSMELMFHIAVSTAMRLQEIFLLKWSHINFDTGMINLPSGNTKANRSRQIPLTKALIPLLLNHKITRTGNNYVLPFFDYFGQHRRNCSGNMSATWKHIFRQAGITDLNFHDLRHEGISRMVERTTLTLTQLQKISGHSDSRTFDRYNNLRTENITQNFY